MEDATDGINGEAAAPAAGPQAFVAQSFERAGVAGRAHQIDAVSKLLLAVHDADAAASEGAAPSDNLIAVSHGVPAAAPVNARSNVASSSAAPAARNYLLQHSAGSGKSLTIAALVHGLLAYKPAAGSAECSRACAGGCGCGGGGRGGEFGAVLVVNDRLQLDAQLGDTIASFLAGNGHPPGALLRAGSVAELERHLLTGVAAGGVGAEDGDGACRRPVVVLTTIQKLAALARRGAAARAGGAAGRKRGRPGAAGGDSGDEDEEGDRGGGGPEATLGALRQARLEEAGGGGGGGGGVWGGRVAVICDEAHRHHGRGSSDAIHSVLCNLGRLGRARTAPGARRSGGKGAAGGAAPAQVEQPAWVSYFGFTATPQPRALQMFGVRRSVLLNALGDVEAVVDSGGQQQQQQQQQKQKQQQQQEDGAPDADADAAPLVPAELFAPFHSYTLHQAIADGHVLDALRRFTALTPRLEISGVELLAAAAAAAAGGGGGAEAERPAGGHDGRRGQQEEGDGEGQASPALAERLLLEAANNSRALVEAKAAEIAERFVSAWRASSGRLNGDGGTDDDDDDGGGGGGGFAAHFRGMVVCRSRQHVAWFTLALRRELLRREAEVRPLLRTQGARGPCGAGGGPAGDGERGGGGWAAEVEAMVFGAFSGRVGEAEGDGAPAPAPVGAGGDAQETPLPAAAGSGRKRRREQGRSAWDVALAHLDGIGQQQQQEQEQQQQEREEARQDKHQARAAVDADSEEGVEEQLQQRRPRIGQRRRVQERPMSPITGVAARRRVLVNSSDIVSEGEPGNNGSGSDISSGSDIDSDAGSDISSFEGSGSDSSSESGASDDGSDAEGPGEGEDGSGGGSGASNGQPPAGAPLGRRGGARGDDDDEEEEEEEKEEEEEALPLLKRCRSSSIFGSFAAAATSDGVGRSDGDVSPRAAPAATAGLPVRRAASGSGKEGRAASGGGLPPQPPPAGALWPKRRLVRRDASLISSGTSLGAAVGFAPAARVDSGQQQQQRPPPAEAAPARGGAGADGPGGAQQGSTSPPSSGGGGGGDTAAGPASEWAAGGGAAEVTEAALNGGRRDPSAARLLVVCSKYETGYDDPRLAMMFVDRPLAGARAVQVLGRLSRPAPRLGKPLPQVVDFVNSAEDLRDAVAEFYLETTHCTAKAARRARQLRQLEACVARILERLQAAAAREGPMAGGLAGMSAGAAAAAAARRLGPEAVRRLEEDVSAYVALCGMLRSDCLELPLPFASALAGSLNDARRRAERAAASGRFAWMEQLVSSGAASPPAGEKDAEDVSGGGGSGGEVKEQRQQQGQEQGQSQQQEQHQQQQQQQQQSEGQQQRQEARALAARGLGVQVNVRQLEETFCGAISMHTAAAAGALGGAALGGSLRPLARDAAGPPRRNAAAAKRCGAAKDGPEAAVEAGRPLRDVIAAANARLRGWAERRAAAGLGQLCSALERAAGRPATSSAAEAGAAPAGGDACVLLALLRRLLLWPVTMELLKLTAAGKRVAALRRHANPQVSSLAAEVVACWRAQVEAAAAAERRRRERAASGDAAAGQERGPAAGAAGRRAIAAAADAKAATRGASAGDAALRSKALQLLVNSLEEHCRSAAERQQEGAAARAAAAKGELSSEKRERITLLAEQLEAALHKVALDSSSSGGGGGGGGGALDGWRAAYSARVKAVAAALRHADGVAAPLLSGDAAPEVVARMGSDALAPAGARALAEARAARARRQEETWERLMAEGGVGGGGTHVSYDRECPACRARRAQVHVVLSGGTYAIERFEFQKCCCLDCGHTWRVDL